MRFFLFLLFLASSLGMHAQDTVFTVKTGKWTDTLTWSTRKIPQDKHIVVQNKHTLVVDTSTSVQSITVNRGGTLNLDPKKSLTLTSKGNIVIHGRMVDNHLSIM